MRTTTSACPLIIAVFTMAFGLSATHAQEPDWNQGGDVHIFHSIDSTRNIDLERQLTLNIEAGHTVSLHGSVAGPAGGLYGLVKQGGGRLELWGDNSAMVKQTVLREGTLHLGGRYALGHDAWASLLAHSGTTLSYAPDTVVVAALHLHDTSAPGTPPDIIEWRVDNGMATQIGPIHGTLPLIKRGAGTLHLSGANTHPDSRLHIAQGGVHLDGQFAGHIHVLDHATLSGSGHTGWLTVSSGGRLAPTDHMTVTHSLQLQSGSQLQLKAWADGRHDSLSISHGSADLDGHVLILPQGPAESWQQGVDYVIVTSQQALGSGQFASVESALPYLNPSLSYHPHQVILHLQPHTGTPDTHDSDPAAGWTTSLRSRLMDDSRFIRDAVYTHAPTAPGFWTHAFHSSGERHAQGDTHGDKRRIRGILSGISRDISLGWRLGLYAGVSRTDTSGQHMTPAHDAQARAHIDSTHLGLYTHRNLPLGTQLTAGVAHSWHRIHSQRPTGLPSIHPALNSRYRAHTTQAFVRAAHPLWVSLDQHTSVTPYARLAWVQTRQTGHTEHGGPLARRVTSGHAAVLFSSVGVAARHQMTLPRGTATVTADIAWRHASGDTNHPVSTHFRDDIYRTSYDAYGLAVARHLWQLRLGIRAELGKHSWVDMHYAGQHGSGSQDHGVQLGLSMRW